MPETALFIIKENQQTKGSMLFYVTISQHIVIKGVCVARIITISNKNTELLPLLLEKKTKSVEIYAENTCKA